MGHIALIQTTAVFYDHAFERSGAPEAIRSLRKEMAAAAREECRRMDWENPAAHGRLYAKHLVGPLHSSTNGYVMVILIPDGSKSGWDTHDQFLGWRGRLEQIASTHGGGCTHVVINGADAYARVITSDIEEYDDRNDEEEVEDGEEAI